MLNFDKGDRVKVAVSFAINGVLVDPATVTMKYQDPSLNETTLVYGTDAALVKAGTGLYYVLVDADESGQWYVRYSTTGSYQTAIEDSFYVRTSQF